MDRAQGSVQQYLAMAETRRDFADIVKTLAVTRELELVVKLN